MRFTFNGYNNYYLRIIQGEWLFAEQCWKEASGILIFSKKFCGLTNRNSKGPECLISTITIVGALKTHTWQDHQTFKYDLV